MSVKELKLTSEKRGYVLKAPASSSKTNKSRLIVFSVAVALLALLFSAPLYHLLRLAANDDLYSDIPLIPLLSLYLIWLRRERIPKSLEPAPLPAVLFSLAGLLVLAAWWLPARQTEPPIEDYLAANILGWLLLFCGVCFLFLGKSFMRAFTCPVALLAFMIPFPLPMRQWVDSFLQHGSAVFAGLFFGLTGAPVTRDGLNFHLPNIVLRVAPECSGIHSTMVLTIVSITAAWLFLRSTWKQVLLVLVVIPLALIRNGFRIFVIGRLCIAYGPQMLNSPIHRHGGPLFFALSLLPFFLVLLLLRKTEGINREPSTRPSL
ncbi:MAG TPA: exosortase/archaeosortase family protein [Verrucomicrobiae bacterium]|jgi:exosortase C (VPDSG-CTERM-specific)|nr:exosortase/archaeosortase family protein [Verrucomicrobiae bacterium]